MQVSTNSNPYLYAQMIAQMGAATPNPGQNVPNQAANPSASSSSSSSIAAPAMGSTPSSQFSSALLSQLIQMQSGSSPQSSGSSSSSSVLSGLQQNLAAGAGDAASVRHASAPRRHLRRGAIVGPRQRGRVRMLPEKKWCHEARAGRDAARCADSVRARARALPRREKLGSRRGRTGRTRDGQVARRSRGFKSAGGLTYLL